VTLKGCLVFSGFCLSKEYGKISYSNPTQTSIGLGLEVASFEHFYSNCEHSNFSSASDTLVKTKQLLDAEKYYEEIKTQKEALENYVSHHYFCKTKVENDATILKQAKVVRIYERKVFRKHCQWKWLSKQHYSQ
jgi:hypothetical protein